MCNLQKSYDDWVSYVCSFIFGKAEIELQKKKNAKGFISKTKKVGIEIEKKLMI